MANMQNDPGQQTKIKQGTKPPPDPKSAARTPLAVDDVSPSSDPSKGRNAAVPNVPFKGI